MSDENNGVSLNLNLAPSSNSAAQSNSGNNGASLNVNPITQVTPTQASLVKPKPQTVKPVGQVLEQGTVSTSMLGDISITSSNDLPVQTPAAPVSNIPQNLPGADINEMNKPKEAQTQLYSSENEANNQSDLEDLGFDLNIKQEKPVSALDLKDGVGSVVDSIVAESTVNAENEQKILDELQQMNPELDLDIPVAPNVNSSADIARKIFIGVVIVAVIVLTYLFINPMGGAASLTGFQEDPLEAENTALSIAKADVIADHYLIAGLAMQNMDEAVAKFAIATSTIDSKFASYFEKKDAEDNLNSYKSIIQDSFNTIEEQLTLAKQVESDTADMATEFTLYMADKVRDTKDPLEKSRLETALKLSRQNELLAEIQAVEVSELGNTELLNLITGLLEGIQTDNMTRLAYVQARRVSWTNVISQLEDTTRNVDPDLSHISYSSYNLNSDTRKISVSGKLETPDEKTFTLLTLLIDELNKPDNPFENANNTSFSKTLVSSDGEGSEEEKSYTSSLRLDFNLQ